MLALLRREANPGETVEFVSRATFSFVIMLFVVGSLLILMSIPTWLFFCPASALCFERR